jgi:tetratricopeptide (TPR) repeat protein
MKALSVTLKSSVAIVALVVAGLGSLSALAADSEVSGRRHAAKANQLAAKNKCKSALPEFTKAYKSLKDPTILFNRAECQRKLGNNAAALKDYEQFLIDMPTAPNRTSVEARMAALREAIKAEISTAPVAPALPVVAPLPPVAPAAPAVPAAPAASGTNQLAPEDTKQVDKILGAPVHRAEKWAD